MIGLDVITLCESNHRKSEHKIKRDQEKYSNY